MNTASSMAIDPETDKLDSSTPEIWRASIIAFLFLGVFGGWAALAPLDSGVVAHGVVVVSEYRKAVQHRDGGVVSAIAVNEGDFVNQGDVVMELEGSELEAQERAMSGRVIELQARRARLQAEIRGQRNIVQPPEWTSLPERDLANAQVILAAQSAELVARTSSVSSQISVLNQQRTQLEARIPGHEQERASAVEQIRLLDEEITGIADLVEKQLAPVSRLRALKAQTVELKGRIGQIDAQIVQARDAAQETELKVIALQAQTSAERASKLREAETDLAEYLPRYKAISEQLERTRLRAPATGRVVGLSAFTVGGVIQPGAHVMDVVPDNSPILIEANVPPEYADNVAPGQVTEIRITAFRGRSLPLMYGTVEKISADRIVDERSGQAFFRTQVKVNPEDLELLSRIGGPTEESLELLPGLPADIVIKIRQRTALQYLLEPLNTALWRSFREE